jgi:hypothetical protein
MPPNEQDWKLGGWGHHSSGRVPAYQVWDPEYLGKKVDK